MSSIELSPDGLYFLPLGGTNEVGMNFSLYAYGDQWIAVDLGMGFGRLPWQEVLVPDPGAILPYRSHLKGLLITHAHEDHLGGIPYIWPHLRCPVYATAFSAYLIREKLQEFDLVDKVPLIEVAPQATIQLGVFSAQFISVTHSVPESSILAIKTPKGTIVHTGDWRLDPTPPVGAGTDTSALEALGKEGVRALVCDSTNIFQDAASASESYIREQLEQLVGQYPHQNIVITCFASNVARLESCALAAKAHGRKSLLVGRSLKRIERVARAAGYLKEVPAFLDEKTARTLPPEKILYICTGSQGESRAALSRAAEGAHPVVRLQSGDVVIFSSREIPGNEHSIAEVQNKLAGRGVRSLTIRTHDVHVSGHPSKEELKKLYSWVRPELVVPIHGGARQLLEHADFAREQGVREVLVPHDGLLLRLDAGADQSHQEVKARTLVVDGLVLLPRQGKAHQERLRGASEGIVFVTVSAKGKQGKLLKMSAYGLFEESEQKEEQRLLEAVQDDFEELCGGGNRERAREGSREPSHGLHKAVSTVVRKIFAQERGRKPQVVVHIV
ncbi:MAG: ribonuclease J [Holosporales bacterium]|nr:ribonuclease J [Holosporales bacterium]